jgi:hypothetical protein
MAGGAGWIAGEDVHQLVVLRGHLMSQHRWEHLLALRRTGIGLVVICQHRRPDGRRGELLRPANPDTPPNILIAVYASESLIERGLASRAPNPAGLVVSPQPEVRPRPYRAAIGAPWVPP